MKHDKRGNNMEFKDKVIFARARLNLSQAKFGERLNVSLATICRWETGKVQPTNKDRIIFEQFCKENKITFDEVNKNEEV